MTNRKIGVVLSGPPERDRQIGKMPQSASPSALAPDQVRKRKHMSLSARVNSAAVVDIPPVASATTAGFHARTFVTSESLLNPLTALITNIINRIPGAFWQWSVSVVVGTRL